MDVDYQQLKDYPKLIKILDEFNELAYPRTWNVHMIKNVKIVDIQPSKLTIAFKVDKTHCRPSYFSDPQEIEHASPGCIVTVMDVFSSFAIGAMSDKRAWDYWGPTSGLNVHFFEQIPIGTVIYMEFVVMHINKLTLTVEGRVYNEDSTILYAEGTHTQINVLKPKL
ncbi:hypothetical protein DFQ28_011311 [Apophysomyces sp. BC1034]|nr:hypothetical protein DFQ30_005526 [Apophysomyces sp. BC1015]KAG0177732.1 hypothetical protein DFQ29_004482 [Apophysomyces sp. BC1021]KAG0184364.1 hypothetical protein DFQ28_011311 [Apophysomyces sp. BC1034]